MRNISLIIASHNKTTLRPKAKDYDCNCRNGDSGCRGVVVIVVLSPLPCCSGYDYCTLHSIKPELRFCEGSNPARGVSEIRDGEDL